MMLLATFTVLTSGYKTMHGNVLKYSTSTLMMIQMTHGSLISDEGELQSFSLENAEDTASSMDIRRATTDSTGCSEKCLLPAPSGTDGVPKCRDVDLTDPIAGEADCKQSYQVKD